ncbi:MAG: Ferredoxin-2 [Anaerocolumna sp.]|nr:Ferredoxin-2 [Anaerocolumna sp.]
MSILIHPDKCVGCGKCRVVCPGSLLWKEKDSNKTIMKYPDECWGCTSCLKECKFNAISYFLGADIGGNGTMMQVEQKGHELHWHITEPNGETKVITIDTRKANSY